MITKRDDTLSAIKAYMSQINLQHGTTTVPCPGRQQSIKTTDRVKKDMLRSTGKQSGESVESVRKKKRYAGGKDFRGQTSRNSNHLFR